MCKNLVKRLGVQGNEGDTCKTILKPMDSFFLEAESLHYRSGVASLECHFVHAI